MRPAAVGRVERSGPAIRAALERHAPQDVAEFEADFQQALDLAASTFDVAPLQATLDRWWGIAAIRANPLTDEEQTQLARAREGDFTGLSVLDEHGAWTTL